MTGIDLQLVAAFVAAAILGAMLFFAVVVAPLVFRYLPADMAGTFLRGLFPRYYDVLAVATFIAAALSFEPWPAVVLLVVALLFLFSRFWLMPRINAARDAEPEGGSDKRFRHLHGTSVLINLAQMIALLVVVIQVSRG